MHCIFETNYLLRFWAFWLQEFRCKIEKKWIVVWAVSNELKFGTLAYVQGFGATTFLKCSAPLPKYLLHLRSVLRLKYSYRNYINLFFDLYILIKQFRDLVTNQTNKTKGLKFWVIWQCIPIMTWITDKRKDFLKFELQNIEFHNIHMIQFFSNSFFKKFNELYE